MFLLVALGAATLRPGGWLLTALLPVCILGLFSRRGHASGGNAALRILERHPLGKDGEVVLLHAEGQPLLLAYGPPGIRIQRLEPVQAVEVHRG